MIDLRNGMVNAGSKEQIRKICPVLPPIVRTKTVNKDGEVVTESEIMPIVCFGKTCGIFCEIHGMCIQKCEHLEIIHGIASPDETDDTEGTLG
jgi:hypothetical protein